MGPKSLKLGSLASSYLSPERMLAICKASFSIDCVSSFSYSNRPPHRSSTASPMEDEIELKTAPADFRFPTTNQTRHCFTRYIEFHRCTAAKGEESNECERFAEYYRALCPGEWVDKWNEQRETGTFPGPL